MNTQVSNTQYFREDVSPALTYYVQETVHHTSEMGVLYDRVQLWVWDNTGKVDFVIIKGSCVQWNWADSRFLPITFTEFNLALLGAIGVI